MSMNKPFLIVVRHELRLLASEPTLVVIALFLAALIAYGLFNGLTEVRRTQETHAAISHEHSERVTGLVAQLRAIAAGTEKPDWYYHPGDPSRVGSDLGATYATLPPTPLAPLALGRSNLVPQYFRVTDMQNPNSLHKDTLENPWHLRHGRFDLAFVMIYIVPLLVFALSYNLLSREREQGTLKLLLAQSVSLRTLVLGKIAVRASLLLGMAILIPATVIVISQPALAGSGWLGLLALWAAMIAVYAAFWFALAVIVNSLGKSSAANAMLLVSAWVLLVLVIPVVLNVTVMAAHPVPSRAQMVTSLRDAQQSIDQRVPKAQWEAAVEGKFKVRSSSIRLYRIRHELNETIVEPQLTAVDVSLAAQQALVDRLRFLSPAIVAHEALSDLAGTGLKRYRYFTDQVSSFYREWQRFFYPRVYARSALAELDYRQMPRFSWQEEERAAVSQRIGAGLLGLLLPTALLLAFGMYRLRRYPQT